MVVEVKKTISMVDMDMVEVLGFADAGDEEDMSILSQW